jgi:hypothetical protein
LYINKNILTLAIAETSMGRMNTTEMLIGVVACVLMLILFRWIRQETGKSASKVRQNRLSRVQKAIRVFAVCVGISLLMGAYCYLCFLLGWRVFGQDGWRMVVSHHIYSSRAEVPPDIFWLLVLQQGFALGAMGVLLRLFYLYAKGILFSAKNVNCIRLLGYWLVVDWFINYQMQGMLRDMDLSTTPVFGGFLIIFVAWIMDEGRKMQEEQELIV